jgi:hypothetical protein
MTAAATAAHQQHELRTLATVGLAGELALSFRCDERLADAALAPIHLLVALDFINRGSMSAH